MKSIFEAVQTACERPIWSKGVQLARSKAVSVEERSDHDIALRVVTRGGLHAPLVTLHGGTTTGNVAAKALTILASMSRQA